jgi:dihydropyrimidine dehydrogenase (NAD+) subunit PreA
MANLKVDFLGMHFPNPFMLASGPPTRTAAMIRRAFAAGWGGAVTKTILFQPTPDHQPRLQAHRNEGRNIGMENIEVLSQLSVAQWQKDLAELKAAYPERPVWASLAASDKDEWIRLSEILQETGIDALELNVSCPHGMPDRGMGAFIGQNAELTGQVVAWVKSVAKIPVIVKLMPNVTDIAFVAKAAQNGGADGLCASNSVASLNGIDLDTLDPTPSVGGFSIYGGYSGPGIKPIALRCVAKIAKATGLPISGLGGIDEWRDTIEFLAVGAATVQLCTAVMWRGYGIINDLLSGLNGYLDQKGYPDIQSILGVALPKIVDFPSLPLTWRVQAQVDETCIGCLDCVTSCNDSGFQAIRGTKGKPVTIDASRCDGCGLCLMVCPQDSIRLVPR